MRTLEVRRHSLREEPNKHLSKEGIALARRVGAGTGPFDLVVTSPAARALETAAAMGFAIDETRDELGTSREAWQSLKACGEFASFAQVRESVRTIALCTSFAAGQALVWREIVSELNCGGRALVITHGHLVEAGAVAVLPAAPYADWGGPIGCCEGVRLFFDGQDCTGGEVLRTPQA